MSDTQTKERGRVVSGGAGGFLNPPTHPEHTLSVETDLGRKPENRGSLSLSYAAEEAEWLDDVTRARARMILDEWQAPAIDSDEIRDWVAGVLGYFRNCYKGTGENPWNASELDIDPKRDPMQHADEHAGVRYVRKFYPDFTPTRDDFERAHWGKRA